MMDDFHEMPLIRRTLRLANEELETLRVDLEQQKEYTARARRSAQELAAELERVKQATCRCACDCLPCQSCDHK